MYVSVKLLLLLLYIWNIVIVIPFFFRILTKINRGPIDLIEGESELVPEFKIEYFVVVLNFIILFWDHYFFFLYYFNYI